MSFRFGLGTMLLCAFTFSATSAGATAEGPVLVDLTDQPRVRTSVVVHGQGYFPVVNRTPDGRAVVILRGGAGHLGVGGRLDLLFSDDGLNWYGKRTAVDTCVDDRNPAFGVTPTGRFLLGWHWQASYNGHGVWMSGLGLAWGMQAYSEDAGLNWSRMTPLQVGNVGSHSPYGRIIRLEDGAYLQNVYGAYAKIPGALPPAEGARDYAYLIRSTDEGLSWGDPSLIAAGHNETALLELPGGNLLAAARSDQDQHLDLYRSSDRGRSWAHAVRATAERQHPADLVNLGGGEVLLLFGNRQQDRDIRGILSRDGGATWETGRHLRLTKPVSGDFGYPSAVVLGDHLLLLYYWAGDAASSYDGSKAQCRAALIPLRLISEGRP